MTININYANHTIELTKKFAAKAQRYGTAEYNSLQDVRRDYPNYRVVIRRAPKRTNTESFKGLTYDFMKLYIKTYDSEQLVNFYALCGKDEHGNKSKVDEALSYGEVKRWFLENYKEQLNPSTLRTDKVLMGAA